jgi:hypothetical protein
MANTIRENIIAAYATRLSAMTIANGYTYNCGASVHRAAKNIDSSDIPACVYWPGVEEAGKSYGRHICKMSVKVEALVEFGSVNPSVVQEQLLGDLKKCLFSSSSTVPTGLIETAYSGGGPADFPNGEDTITAVSVEFNVTYNETIGNPYAS